MLEYSLEHIFSYQVQLQPPEMIGSVPDGIRANVYTSQGTVTGKKVNGILRPVGGDWVIVRPDGVAMTDVRGTIETVDGALIYITYTGMMDLGENGYQNALQSQFPATAKIRNTPRLQTAHPSYQWLNRLQYISIAEIYFTQFQATFDVYALH
jgi:hypothetical protein